MISKTLKQYIKQCKFDYVHPSFKERNFPFFKSLPNMDTELIVFNQLKDLGKNLQKLKRRNLRPANLKEFLAYIKENSLKAKDYTFITTLDAHCFRKGKFSYAPLFLYGTDLAKSLLLGSFPNNWKGNCAYLAVRKGRIKATA